MMEKLRFMMNRVLRFWHPLLAAGARSSAGVATTDLYGNCTMKHSGTSAAAPEAAGVIALALEANPSLTWRDIQHLLVLTSKKRNLMDVRYPWKMNGAGFLFNHLFGYGVMDAGSLVDASLSWKPLPERKSCEAGELTGEWNTRTGEQMIELEIDTNACKGSSNEINYIEHVQAFISIQSTRRGDITINMTSPMNTESMLLQRRPRDDDSETGLIDWPFVSVQYWGEKPSGKWRLVVALKGVNRELVKMTKFKLVIYGTTDSWPYMNRD